MDESTIREIEAAINAFDKDDQAKVLVFHGEGGSFSSGFDLDELGEKGYYPLRDAAVSRKKSYKSIKKVFCDTFRSAFVRYNSDIHQHYTYKPLDGRLQ